MELHHCIGLGNGGACWLASHLYEQLELDRFWAERFQQAIALKRCCIALGREKEVDRRTGGVDSPV
jgi:hypothetical protein